MKQTWQRRRAAGEGGFTLVELLVVIVILGILSGVVVFAVSGIDDKGQDSACKTDTSTIRTAEEAYLANLPATAALNYTTTDDLALKGFLSDKPTLHKVDAGDITPATASLTSKFVVKVASAKCGTVGNSVGQTPSDL